MGKLKKEMETRCELALMGKVVEVNSNDEVQAMTDYILAVLGREVEELDIMGDHINKYCLNKVDYLVCNNVHGMLCITYLLENNEEDGDEYPKPFEEDYGSGHPCAFCYVYNVDVDYFSEFGDCFFEKRADGYYHRMS